MRFPLAIALFCLFGFAIGAAEPVTVPEDSNVRAVRESFEARMAVNYIGEIETIRFESRRAEATIVRIEHRAPNYTRRWYLAPPSLFGDSVVIRDRQSFEFDEHHHTLIESSNQWTDEAGLVNRKALLSKNFRIVNAGTGIVAGRRVQRIHLLQRSSGRRLVTLALDSETNLPLQRETYRSDGSIAYRMRFNSIKYLSPDHLPLTIFSTAPPAGFRVIERNSSGHHSKSFADAKSPLVAVSASSTPPQVEFTPPESLPDGFHLLRSTSTTIGGMNARQWIFSDGVRSLSLFASSLDQHPVFKGLHPRTLSLGNTSAIFVEAGSDALLSWQTKQHILTLVGDLTAEELVNIARHCPQ